MSDLPYFEERAKAVLSYAFGGLHNVPGKLTRTPYRWEVTCFASLATHDFDQLTRIVIAAHEHCVRVEIQPCNPQYIRLMLHPRQRTGCIFERHPSLDDLSERIGKRAQPPAAVHQVGALGDCEHAVELISSDSTAVAESEVAPV